MSNKMTVWPPVALLGGLFLVLALHLAVAAEAWQARNETLRATLREQLVQLADEIEHNHHCFELFTEVTLPPNAGLRLISGADSAHRVFQFVDPRTGQLEVYPYADFKYADPIKAEAKLTFSFLGSEDVGVEGFPTWIDSAYANTVRHPSGFRVIDSLHFKQQTAQLFSGLVEGAKYRFEVADAGSGQLVYSTGQAVEPDLSLSVPLYDEPNFHQHFKLTVGASGLAYSLLGNLGYWLLAAALVLGLEALVVYYFFKMMRKQTELASERIEFLNNTAHAFKTPLANINLAASTMAKTGNQPAEQQQLLEVIAEESKRLSQQLSGTLKGLDGESGTERVNVARLVREVVHQQRHGMAHARLSINIDERLELETDAQKLKLALGNVLENAVHYGHTEKPEIGLSAARVNGHLLLAVSDNGIGVEAEDEIRIFEKHYRSRAAIGRRLDGSGLGLYYSRRALEKIGATISAKAREAGGTEVTITLPIQSKKHE